MEEKNSGLETKTAPGLPWWKFVLLVFLLGPLPVLGLALVDESRVLPGEIIQPPNVIAFFGAWWGLAAGVLRRSLMRMIIGLNVGAIVGFATRNIIEELLYASLYLGMIFLSAAYGIVLTAACVDIKKQNVLRTGLRWFVIGMLVVVSFFVSAWLIDKTPIGQFVYIPFALIVSPTVAMSVLVYFVTNEGDERSPALAGET